ncbi:MAG: RHS repeat protein [Acidobacteria bacterium]|nr:RHS repeat protein [Acidobacteriota bacterium]
MPRDDDPQTNARRKQKSYEDILGRAFKAETYEWDGTTVYSTVVNTYNGRDQVTLLRQYAGTALSETYQDTTASYDGHGRTVGQKLPQQDSPGTVFTYNPDGSVLTRTDARGVVTNYAYNNRGLVTGITWDVGSTGVTETAAVGFDYDNLGNRIEMTDGLGTQTYEYDELSRLTAETRSFTDTLVNAPLPDNSFRLEYTYHLAGQLKSLKDPYGQQINYGHDRAGKMFSVWGSTSFAGISTYLGAVNYRAWGGIRSITYGNGNTQTTTFDEALRPSDFVLEKDSTAKMDKSYEYYTDGRLRYTEDNLNPVFDRLQRYEHQGRLAAAFSGLEARGGTVSDPQDQKTQLPYRQTYGFNAFDNLTSRTNLNWGTDNWAGVSFNQSLAHLNNRITESGYQYDADGRNTVSVDSEEVVSTFDAAGYLVRIQKSYTQAVPNPNDDLFRYLDGNGREGKRLQKDWIEPEPESNYQWVDRPLRFYIRSTVMGGEVISEANETGQKLKTIVYAGGEAIAWQTFDEYGATVVFEHYDASRMTRRMTKPDGSTVLGTGIETSAAEFDALGQSIGIENPYPSMTPGGGEGCIGCGSSGIFGIDDNSTIYVNGQRLSMTLDGARISYSSGMSLLYVGASAVCPNNDCGPKSVTDGNGNRRWAFFRAGADGSVGYYGLVSRRITDWVQIGNRVIAEPGEEEIEGGELETETFSFEREIWEYVGTAFRQSVTLTPYHEWTRKPVGGGSDGTDFVAVSLMPDDPNGSFCTRLLKRINNIRANIGRRITDLLTNPQNLPDLPPFPGAPAKTNRLDHGGLINNDMNRIRELREMYRNRCGGDPPPGGSGPAYIPMPRPVRPTVPGGVRPRVPTVPLPSIPVRPGVPFIVHPPLLHCILTPGACQPPIVA